MEITNLELWDAGKCVGIINRQWLCSQLIQFCPPSELPENIEANPTPENQIFNSSEIVQASTTFSQQPDQSCVIESIVEVPKENLKTEVKNEIKLEHQLDEEGNRHDYQTIVPSSSNGVMHHEIQIKKEKEDGILNDLSMVEAPNSNVMNPPLSSASLGSDQSCVIESIVEVPVKNEIKFEHHFGEFSFDSNLQEFIFNSPDDEAVRYNCASVNNQNDCQPGTSRAEVKMEDGLQVVQASLSNGVNGIQFKPNSNPNWCNDEDSWILERITSPLPKSKYRYYYSQRNRGVKHFPAPKPKTNSSDQPDPKKRRVNTNTPTGTPSTTTGSAIDILEISQEQFQQFKEELKKTIESMRPCARQHLTVVGLISKAQFVATSLKINANSLPTLIQILVLDNEFNFREIGIGHLLPGQPNRSRSPRSL